jgi:predicted PurR-regulated permease PerM
MDDTRSRPLFAPSRLEPKTVLTACLCVLGVVVVVYALWRTPISIGITVIAGMLAVALDRPIRFLERHGLPRGAGIGIVSVLFVVVIAAFGWILIPALIAQTRGLLELVRRVPHIDRLESLWLQHQAEIVGRALSYARGALQLIGALVMMLIVAIFMLVFGRPAVARLLDEATPSRRPRYQQMVREIYASVSGYLSGVSVLVFCNAVVMSGFLAILRVPYVLPLGLFSGLSVIVPNAGAVISGLALTAVALVAGGLGKAIATIAFFTLYKLFEGDLLQPAVFHRTVHLNPLATLLAVLFMTELAGILAAIVAVPLLGVVQVVLHELLLVRREQYGLPPPSAPLN